MSDVQPKLIKKEDIRELPLYRHQGDITVVNTQEKLDSAMKALSSEPVLGFDTESRPAFRKGDSFPPSLIQLATSDCTYLIQNQQLKDISPVVDLFQNPNILKVGVAIRDDIIHLKDLFDFKEKGFLEVVTLTTKLGLENRGLRGLAAYLLGIRISKSAQVSNWANKTLTQPQILYAATDAWVSREIYIKVQKMIAERS